MATPPHLVDLIFLLGRRGTLDERDLGALSRTCHAAASTARTERLVRGIETAPANDTLRRQVYSLFLKHQPLVNVVCPAFGISVYQLAQEFVSSLAKGHQAATDHHGGRRGEANALDVRSAESFTLTSRSLALDRFLRLPGRKHQQGLMGWSALEGPDNLLTCLALTPDLLGSWRGSRVLDVACGGSIFHAEAAVAFGVQVTPVDLNPQTEQAKRIVAVYAKNMLFMKLLTDLGLAGDCGMAPVDWGLLAKLIHHLPAIVAHYRDNPVQKGSVFGLAFRDGHFDVCLSSWLFSYFDEPQKVAALVELIRVTRAEGQIRICTGMQGGYDVRSAGLTDGVIEAANQRAGEQYGKTLKARPDASTVSALVYDVVAARTCVIS